MQCLVLLALNSIYVFHSGQYLSSLSCVVEVSWSFDLRKAK